MGRKPIDETNNRHGMLTVLEKAEQYKHGVFWKCLCDCGNETIVLATNLRSGNTKSCGCILSKYRKNNQANRKHGHAPEVNGKAKRSPTYYSWEAMKKRCLYPKHIAYDRYAGRGITICDRWLESFENFLADMGERPKELTLDRIDNDGNYEPGNCRWATRSQQVLNQRKKSPCSSSQLQSKHETE